MITRSRSTRLSFLVEAGIMIGLATILSYIKLYSLPNGGSLTAGSMVPILFLGLRYGVKRGIFAGLVYGVLQSILEPYVVHPLQYLLDYPIAFGFLGISGIFSFRYKGNNKKLEYVYMVIGIFLAIFGRFVSHVGAGAVFFSEFAGNQNPWIYSLIYNGSFLLPEFILSAIIILVLWKSINAMGYGR